MLGKIIILITLLLSFIKIINCQPSDSTIKKVSSKIDFSRIENIIKDLSGVNPVIIEGKEYTINNRDTKSPLNSIAAKYVYYKLLDFGYQVHFKLDTHRNVEMETIYAFKFGSVYPNEIVMFVAYHDASTIDSIAPGANENATGLSTILEAARIFKELETERTILFVSYDDWTQTGWGTVFLTDSILKNHKGKLFGIQLSTLGYFGGNPFSIASHDTIQSKNLINNFFYVSNVIGYSYPLIQREKKFTVFAIFNQYGYEEVLFSPSKNPPLFRTSSDTYSNLELPVLYENVRLAISSLAYVARVIDGSLNVKETQYNIDLLFPNPIDGYIYSKQFLGYSYQIFNILGMKVQEGFITTDIIDIKYLTSGLYFIVLKNKEKTIFKKFLKN